MWDWVLHALALFEYAYLMEKARLWVVRYGINDARQWDHMRECQLVILTSPLEPGLRSQNGRHNSLGHMGIAYEWIIRTKIWAFQMNGL